jgi:UDP-glucuronate decarboxylase
MSAPVVFDKKNILVTGGAGFVGSHLCERLLKDSRVICMDNFVSSSESNIDLLLKNPDFEFIRHDINDPFDLDAFPELARFKLKFQGIQEIYHFAAPTSPKRFDQFRMQTLYTNSVGAKNVMDLAVKYGAKVLLASSAVIYGPRPADGRLFREDDNGSVDLLSPRACYDEGKRFMETVGATYALVHGLDVKIARLFRTYGPRLPLFDGHMIPDFILNALDGKPLQIFGDETFRTSLVYVDDVVDAVLKLMKAPKDMGPVNIGNDLDIPIIDVAQRVLEMTGSSSAITFQPPLLFMSQQGLPDISKAKEKLGWLPLVTIDDGLKKVIDYTIANKALLSFRPKE